MIEPSESGSEGGSADGRRRRGQDNRARIVAAMIDLVRGGQIPPSAEQVATHAGVGLRTVFRHFQDMDTLYREMSATMETELRAIVDGPLKASDWRGRILELAERRALAFEKIAPFRRAADAVRHRSAFLKADEARLATVLRAALVAELSDDAQSQKVEMLDLLLSFETWSRLRNQQHLSPEKAHGILRDVVSRIICS